MGKKTVALAVVGALFIANEVYDATIGAALHAKQEKQQKAGPTKFTAGYFKELEHPLGENILSPAEEGVNVPAGTVKMSHETLLTKDTYTTTFDANYPRSTICVESFSKVSGETFEHGCATIKEIEVKNEKGPRHPIHNAVIKGSCLSYMKGAREFPDSVPNHLKYMMK